METHDRYNHKYNQPYDYHKHIYYWLNTVWPELKPYKDYCQFIYAGHHSDFIINNNRTEDSVLNQIAEASALEKFNIFFECASEAICNQNIIVIHRIVKKAKLLYPNCKFFYITGEANGKRSYNELCERWNEVPVLEIISCYFFECVSCYYGINQNSEYPVRNKNKNYSCLNRVLRPHRAKLLDKLLAEGLVNNDCYYSFHDSMHHDGGLSEILKGIQHFPNIECNIDLVKTLRLNFDPARTNPADLRIEDQYLYDDTYFSVITETVYENPECGKHSAFFSEKIYKPIVMLHPFVLIANAGSLATLQERGYKTFHPFIDENYDTIEDGEERMNAIVNEIKRLCGQTPTQWLEWGENVKPIVEHNKKHLHRVNSYIVNKNLISSLYFPA
jgi:hypothetical protein